MIFVKLKLNNYTAFVVCQVRRVILNSFSSKLLELTRTLFTEHLAVQVNIQGSSPENNSSVQADGCAHLYISSYGKTNARKINRKFVRDAHRNASQAPHRPNRRIQTAVSFQVFAWSRGNECAYAQGRPS